MKQKKHYVKIRIRNKLTPENVIEILNHPDWPDRKFVDVALDLGFAKKMYFKFNPAKSLHKLVNNFGGNIKNDTDDLNVLFIQNKLELVLAN